MRAAQILLASGRVPNLEGLNLEALGIETTKAGIAVDEHLRTSVPGIWATGDVTAIAQLTPVAQYQSRIAVADMFEEDGPAADYSVLPTAIFTDPELGGVGLTEDEAREQGLDVGTVTNDHVRRFSFIDAKHGLFKIVFEPLEPPRARSARCLAQRGRHRAGLLDRPAARRHSGRARRDAPHLSDLRGRHQGRR